MDLMKIGTRIKTYTIRTGVITPHRNTIQPKTAMKILTVTGSLEVLTAEMIMDSSTIPARTETAIKAGIPDTVTNKEEAQIWGHKTVTKISLAVMTLVMEQTTQEITIQETMAMRVTIGET